MVTIEYQCADGTPFPVTFADEEQAARPWGIDRGHISGPIAPLHASLVAANRMAGVRAFEEVGLAVPPNWGGPPGPTPFGYEYFVMEPPDPEAMAAQFAAGAKVLEVHGSATKLWKEYCLPRVIKVCENLRNAPADAPADELFENESYGFQLTMAPMVIAGNDMRLLEAVCTPLYEGKEGMLVANELVQGHANKTLQTNQELWELGQSAKSTPEVMEGLATDDPAAAMSALRGKGVAKDFFADVDRFVADFGGRCEEWTFATPTWEEQGKGFWDQVRKVAVSHMLSPAETLAAAAERRKALIADVEARLEGNDDDKERFHRRLNRLDGYVDVREERALWQLVLHGRLRGAYLRRGQALVDAGVIDAPEDIMFLTVDELELAASIDRRPDVARRRAEHERWSQVIPPANIGAPPPQSEATEDAPLSGDALRGTAVSRGVATGRARVIHRLDDAHRLEPGDVLVCAMTSPSWTPLFGIAAAIVVDAGGMGSHPAIAAREYGIPAVLGTKTGTHAIPDGAVVTVDGLAGVVTWKRD